jgi:hypothetical protein
MYRRSDPPSQPVGCLVRLNRRRVPLIRSRVHPDPRTSGTPGTFGTLGTFGTPGTYLFYLTTVSVTSTLAISPVTFSAAVVSCVDWPSLNTAVSPEIWNDRN